MLVLCSGLGFDVFFKFPATSVRVLFSCLDVAATFYLRLLDRVVSKAVRLSGGLVVFDLELRRRVTALCGFYKIRCNPNHAF